MRARAKVYHIECFRCVACSRQLIPGDEFALREDGLFCRADHDVVERASMGAGDPLSPLHPARPLQMAGTTRVWRPEGAAGFEGLRSSQPARPRSATGPAADTCAGVATHSIPPSARLHPPTAEQRLRDLPLPEPPTAGSRSAARTPLRPVLRSTGKSCLRHWWKRGPNRDRLHNYRRALRL